MEAMRHHNPAYATDEALTEGLFRREEAALEAVQARYGGLMKRLVSRFLGDARDREEAVSDTMLRLWQAIPPHRPASLPAFLTTLARRAAIDRQRHNNRAGAVPEGCLTALDELAELLPSDSGTEDELMAKELGRCLNAFLAEQPPRRREIFLRRYYGAEPVRDMAAAMGVSTSTIEKELKALRHSLKKKLESEGFAV
nr:sigma-70 family RNA polymerase sigma factor [Lachnospiraceae bacterium]